MAAEEDSLVRSTIGVGGLVKGLQFRQGPGCGSIPGFGGGGIAHFAELDALGVTGGGLGGRLGICFGAGGGGTTGGCPTVL